MTSLAAMTTSTDTPNNHRVYIVLPAWNEATVLEGVLQDIQQSGYKDIIVVDDGSRDATFDIAGKSPGVIALRHRLNRGKGAATKTGIEAAKILGASIIVTMDADGQHNPADIARLIEPLQAKRCEVVLGSRLIDSTGMPRHKVLANWIGNLVTWYFYGLWVTDSQSGFRAYSKRAASLINTRSDRYDYESEVIREIYFHKLRFVEVPIEVRYTGYSMGKVERQSFINGLRTLGRIVWRIFT